ncbi:MAG: hypothetical protein LBU27_05450 [Candidatus Peribacteria bacterium]|jgi:methyl-accepting chemotaxis protein|nr:hypothetical protein [Candidatus Peribacteria bacterium]
MTNLNTINTSTTKITQLVKNIAQTCDALVSALEINTQSVGNYGGSVLYHFDSEFVDRVVNSLLKIKYHTMRLDKELKNGLISSCEELEQVVSGLLQTIDSLDTLMLEDGFMKNQFSWAIEELKKMIEQMLNNIEIS